MVCEHHAQAVRAGEMMGVHADVARGGDALVNRGQHGGAGFGSPLEGEADVGQPRTPVTVAREQARGRSREFSRLHRAVMAGDLAGTRAVLEGGGEGGGGGGGEQRGGSGGGGGAVAGGVLSSGDTGTARTEGGLPPRDITPPSPGAPASAPSPSYGSPLPMAIA